MSGVPPVDTLGHSKLSTKHQVTIPKPVRRVLKLHGGDLIVFVREGDRIVLRKGKVKVER